MVISLGVILPNLLGFIITHTRDTCQSTNVLRWGRGTFHGSLGLWLTIGIMFDISVVWWCYKFKIWFLSCGNGEKVKTAWKRTRSTDRYAWYAAYVLYTCNTYIYIIYQSIYIYRFRGIDGLSFQIWFEQCKWPSVRVPMRLSYPSWVLDLGCLVLLKLADTPKITIFAKC